MFRLHHCMKSVRIRNYSGLYFPVFGLNTERHSVSLRVRSECGKIRTRVTSNTDTFYKSSSASVLAASLDWLGPHGSVQVSTLSKSSSSTAADDVMSWLELKLAQTYVEATSTAADDDLTLFTQCISLRFAAKFVKLKSPPLYYY